jgi:dTDP-glucose pyrophosphorylase
MSDKCTNKSKILVVLCLAGTGQRFLDEGIKMPKYFLKHPKNKTSILELIIKNLQLGGCNDFLLIVNKRHKKWKDEFIKVEKNLNIDFKIYFTEDTAGQAETAYIATNLINDHHMDLVNLPIVFHNGDTILKNRDFRIIPNEIESGCYGLIDTFNSSLRDFSYLLKDDRGYVKDIKEKEVISNMATSGFYGFLSSAFYNKIYKDTDFSDGERYISSVYKTMVRLGYKISNLHNNEDGDTLILGTPKDYKAWIKDE